MSVWWLLKIRMLPALMWGANDSSRFGTLTFWWWTQSRANQSPSFFPVKQGMNREFSSKFIISVDSTLRNCRTFEPIFLKNITGKYYNVIGTLETITGNLSPKYGDLLGL